MPGRKKTLPVTAAEEPKKPRRSRKKSGAAAIEEAVVKEAVKEAVIDAVPAVEEAAADEPAPVAEAVPEPAPEEKPKSRGRRKKAEAPAVMIQSVLGGELAVEEIVDRVVKAAKTKNVQIWIKAEENRAYYTVGGAEDAGGFIVLWKE